MIREIKYVFSRSVNYFTCHALFSKLTDGELANINVNTHSKQPQYKVFFQDRVVTIIVNENDLKLIDKLPLSVEFQHLGHKIVGNLLSDNEYAPQYQFNNGDFVYISGVMSYAKKVKSIDNNFKNSSILGLNNRLLLNHKKSAIEYLESRLGVDLKKVEDDFIRFEMISYKNFQDGIPVFSKSNKNKLDFHNVFSFEIQAYVKDFNITNLLDITSIGKKRSYGFGNVEVRIK